MIYGERLRLRAAEREDLPRFVAWLNDPEVRQFLLINLPMSMASEERWFENMQKLPPAEHVLVIEIALPREGGAEVTWTPIGNTSFMDINHINRAAEIGIFIGEKSFWNQGYGRDTMRLMLRHGFETMNFNRIYLRVFDHNLRGIRAYERAGFKHEGRMRQAQYQEGRYFDVLMMSVLREEWK
jgi:diamine N-acetyltransferase